MNPTYEDLMFALRVANVCVAVAIHGESALIESERAFYDSLTDEQADRASAIAEAAREKGWQ